MLSLEQMEEEGSCVAAAGFSTEEEALSGILLDELFVSLGRVNPLYEDVIRLGYQGFGRKEIADLLPVKKSRAYEVIRKCREEAERFLK